MSGAVVTLLLKKKKKKKKFTIQTKEGPPDKTKGKASPRISHRVLDALPDRSHPAVREMVGADAVDRDRDAEKGEDALRGSRQSFSAAVKGDESALHRGD